MLSINSHVITGHDGGPGGKYLQHTINNMDESSSSNKYQTTCHITTTADHHNNNQHDLKHGGAATGGSSIGPGVAVVGRGAVEDNTVLVTSVIKNEDTNGVSHSYVIPPFLH